MEIGIISQWWSGRGILRKDKKMSNEFSKEICEDLVFLAETKSNPVFEIERVGEIEKHIKGDLTKAYLMVYDENGKSVYSIDISVSKVLFSNVRKGDLNV